MILGILLESRVVSNDAVAAMSARRRCYAGTIAHGLSWLGNFLFLCQLLLQFIVACSCLNEHRLVEVEVRLGSCTIGH